VIDAAARLVGRAGASGQLIRFGIVGGAATALHALLFLGAADGLGVAPLLANVIAYVVGVCFSFVLHRHWSFRDQIGADVAARRGMVGRFAVSNLIAFALNSLIVWIVAHQLARPNWMASALMLTLTPIATFALHRFWTFRGGTSGSGD
jgi:putative flippase GtrA